MSLFRYKESVDIKNQPSPPSERSELAVNRVFVVELCICVCVRAANRSIRQLGR